MNKFIKVIWSRTRGALVAVSEHQSTQTNGVRSTTVSVEPSTNYTEAFNASRTTLTLAVGVALLAGSGAVAASDYGFDSCVALGGTMKNGICRKVNVDTMVSVQPRGYSLTVNEGDTKTIGLGIKMSSGTGDVGQITNNGSLTVDGTTKKNSGTIPENGIDIMAENGSSATILNQDSGELIICGGEQYQEPFRVYESSGIGTMNSGGGIAYIVNKGSGSVVIKGGPSDNSIIMSHKLNAGIGHMSTGDGSAFLVNEGSGSILIQGGDNDAEGAGIAELSSGGSATISNLGSGSVIISGAQGQEKNPSYGINTVAALGGKAVIANTGDGELVIQGGSRYQEWSFGGINYIANGGEAKIVNSGGGILKIKGGSIHDGGSLSHSVCGISIGASSGGKASISNDGSGKLLIEGGDLTNLDPREVFDSGITSGIGIAANTDGQATISNSSDGELTISGGMARWAYGIGVGASGGSILIENKNTGILTIQGGLKSNSSGINILSYNKGEGTIINSGSGLLKICGQSTTAIGSLTEGGSSSIINSGSGTLLISGEHASAISSLGRDYFLSGNGEARIINSGIGDLIISGSNDGSNGSGIGGIDANYVNASIENTGGGTLTIQAGSGSNAHGIGGVSKGSTDDEWLELSNKDGVMNLLGYSSNSTAIDLGGGINDGLKITNEDILNLNSYAFHNSLFSYEVIFVNKSTGIVNAELGAFFSGYYSEPVSKIADIVVWNGSGVNTVNTDSYMSYLQTGSISIVEEWKTGSTWEDGGTINFTDVAEGTELANSIREQFEAAFGTGTTIKFTGTGGSSGSSGSAVFTSAVVDALVSEGKFSDGSVVTSETLTLDGEAIAFENKSTGWRGWNALGFKGIRGAKSISVSDGRTLTLMGDQASMYMAVRATEGKATSMITDAPMMLAGSNLKLGISALSATQGTLEAVTADAGSSVTAENGIFSISALKGTGKVFVKKNSSYTSQLTLGSMETSGGVNDGVLKVTGDSSLSGQLVNSQDAEMTLSGQVTLEKGAELANLGTLTSGAVVMDAVSAVTNFGNLKLDSIVANGTIRQSAESSMDVTGLFKIRDEGKTTLDGKVTAGTLSVGATEARLLSNDAAGARLVVDGETYVDELELVSGTVDVSENAVLAGKTLKDGGIGSKVSVATGGTFAFSYDEAGLDKFLEGYKGDRDDKAILALSTDLHLKEGGMLTVGSVAKETGAVNLGSDALLLVGTTELHGNALLSGGADQALHAEDGATIAFVDDFIWGNHYLLDGFDAASLEEMSDVGIRDKDGNEMKTSINGRGLYVTIGGTDIREKDAGYRLVENFNVMLDGHQDKDSVHGDVAFLTNALLAETNVGVAASNAVEALNGEAGVLSETLRHAERVQELVTNHALSVRPESGTLWVEGIYADVDSGNLERTTGRSAYDVETTGFMFGADAALKGWNVGAAFSAQRSDLDASSSNTSSDIDAYGFSIYGAKHFEGGWSMVVDASYVSANHDMTAYMLGKTKAETDADAWSVGVRGAKHFALGAFGITPYVGLEVVKASEDAFDSTWEGKSAFRYAEADSTIWRAPVGVKASVFAPVAFGAAKGTLNWSADLSVAPQWGDKEVEHRVSGLNLGRVDGYTAVVTDDYVGKAKLGVSYQTDHGSFSLDYEAQKGDVLKLSHGLSAKAALYF